MNIVINSKCNNHCPYCFEENMTLNDDIMSLDNYKKLIDSGYEFFLYGNNLKILGGEPTLNSDLKEYIEHFISKHPEKQLLIITNLLGLEKNIDYIINLKEARLLINGTYDDNNEELFFNNMKKIKYFRNITLSITLLPNYQLNLKFINKIKRIITNYPIKNFRLGLMQPKASKPLFDIYNYDKEIRMLLEILDHSKVTKINFDCPVNYCEISEELYKELITSKRFNITDLRIRGCLPCSDINPDMSTKYCYSSEDNFRVENVLEFDNYIKLVNHHMMNENKYKIKNKKCKTCKLFKEGKCAPCHAFDQALLRGEKIIKEKKKKEFKEKIFGHKKEKKH